MMEFLKNLPIDQLYLLGYILSYGIVTGLQNTLLRFVSLFWGQYNQSDSGRLFDVLWYTSIFVFVITSLI